MQQNWQLCVVFNDSESDKYSYFLLGLWSMSMMLIDKYENLMFFLKFLWFFN